MRTSSWGPLLGCCYAEVGNGSTIYFQQIWKIWLTAGVNKTNWFDTSYWPRKIKRWIKNVKPYIIMDDIFTSIQATSFAFPLEPTLGPPHTITRKNQIRVDCFKCSFVFPRTLSNWNNLRTSITLTPTHLVVSCTSWTWTLCILFSYYTHFVSSYYLSLCVFLRSRYTPVGVTVLLNN